MKREDCFVYIDRAIRKLKERNEGIIALDLQKAANALREEKFDEE